MRKKDEMEQKVANKAIKITWSVTVLAMFIIGGFQRIMNNGDGSILMSVATLSTTLLILLEQYYLSKLNEDKKFKKMMYTALIVSVILIILLGFLSQ